MTEIKSAIIIGGGIAGILSAYFLSKRGISCRILEKNSTLMSEASGNKKAIINPVLSHESEESLAFLQSAFIEATSFYENIPQGFNQCGSIQLAVNNKIKNFINDFKNSYKQHPLAKVVSLNDYLIPLEGEALFYPNAGILNPKEILKFLIENSSFTINLESEVIDVYESDSEVVVKTNENQYSAQICIFANSFYAAKFFDYPLEAVRGEVVEIPLSTLSNMKLTSPLSFNGYIIPLDESSYLLGSTYDHGNFKNECNFEKQKMLLQRLINIFPNMNMITHSKLSGRVSYRASTPDKLPLVGPIKRNSRIHVNIGHGSRGFQTAVISGRILTDSILGTGDIPCVIDALRILNAKTLKWKRFPWE